MKLNKTIFGLGIGVGILLVFGLYKLLTFTLFDDEFKVLETINVPDKNYSIKIYHIPSNASSHSYIQIRTVDDGIEETIESYEGFDRLESYSLGKDTLVLTIGKLGLSNSEIKKFHLP